MSQNEKIEEIQKKYPNLFKESPRCGFYVGDGWLPLVENLCAIIENHLKYLAPDIDQKEIFVSQVKEKFGGLRFYMNQETPYISGAIAMAESMSYSICETCGKPGKRCGGGYIVTLCEEHDKERKKKK
jgi:hypothetical protein